MSFKRQPLIMSVKLCIGVMARRLNSVCNINFIIANCWFSYQHLKKMCSSAYRKNKQRGKKVLVKECLKTADKMCCSIKMSLHTFSLIISIILLYISCGASKPQMKSRCSQCLMSRWYTNLGICVSSRAMSWGSARVSCPPDHKAVGTVMSRTLYRGGVDW